jgi:peptidase YpeB-like protein
MSKINVFAAILVLFVALAPGVAQADLTEASPTAPARRPIANGNRDQEADRRLFAAFRATQRSLGQAMEIAEKLHDGSRTADISFEAAGKPTYRVRTVKNDQVWENVIDANTGRIADKEVASSFKELDRDDLGNIIALRSVRQELADAVRVAESAASGKALGGGLLKEDSHLSFVVLVLSGDRLKEVTLQPPKVGQGSGYRVR